MWGVITKTSLEVSSDKQSKIIEPVGNDPKNEQGTWLALNLCNQAAKKLLRYYKMSNVSQIKENINLLPHSVVFIKKMSLLDRRL